VQSEFIRPRLLERLWPLIDKTATHWWWTGGRFREGYGRVCVSRDCRGVHRVVWEALRGPIPPGLVVCHACDVDFPAGDTTYRACCNPDHLFLATRAENTADMVAKKRSAWGDRNGMRRPPPPARPRGVPGRKPQPRIACVCEVCGKPFEITQADFRRGRGRWCGHACASTKERAPNRTCPRCGKRVYRTPSQIATRANIYCSVSCAVRDRPREPLWSRIWSRIDYGGRGCWPWTGCTNHAGYGVLSFTENGKTRPMQVTRLLWRMIHGRWPIYAAHRCDVPLCCRPSHLFNATPRENNRDMHAKGRARSGGLRGERASGAKLTEHDVREIRRRHADGENYSVLGREHGVSPQAIRALCLRLTWKHVR